MASPSNSIGTIVSFSPSVENTVPFSPVPVDVIGLFFSFLREQDQVNLGKVCKTLNAIYLNVSTVGLGFKQLYTHLKDVVVELTKATQERPLRSRELGRMTEPRFTTPFSADVQWEHDQLIFEANNKLANFYDNFRTSLPPLNTTSALKSSGFFVRFANQIIKSSFKEEKVNEAKLATVTQEFNIKYFNELCAVYGSQPLDTITIESFKAAVSSVREWFTTISPIKIETALRKAIKANHADAEFTNICQEYLNPAANAPRFVAIRAAVEAKLIAEKNAPETNQERLTAIEASLQPDALHTAARNEGTKIAGFYAELTTIASDFNEVRRSQALHALIDG